MNRSLEKWYKQQLIKDLDREVMHMSVVVGNELDQETNK